MTPDPRILAPRWGKRSKSRTPLKSVFSTFSVMETTYADSWSDMAQPCDMDLCAMKWRSAWPIFHSPVILAYILKSIWCMYILLWEYESVWLEVWPQNKCRSMWPIFHGPVILPYILKTVWCMNILIWDYESVGPDVWPQNKCISLWPIFHGPVIFALYLEDCLMYEHLLLGLWISMTWRLTAK